MSEAAPETAPAQEQPTDPKVETPPTVEELQAKLEETVRESRKWESRAKENGNAAKAAERARLDAMSDQERAVEEAKQSARTEATINYGKRLAKTEFDALAGRRNPGFDTASALEFVDLGKFIGEDGEPDTKAIKAAVERLVPTATDAVPNFDGGAQRPATTAQDMSQIIRKATGRA